MWKLYDEKSVAHFKKEEKLEEVVKENEKRISEYQK